VTVAVAVAAEAATEATKQEDDEDNDEYESERHGLTLLFAAQRRVKPRIALTAGALNSMCVEPLLVLVERAKLQLNLPMTISFGARWK